MLRLPAVSRALAGVAHSKGSIATTNNGNLLYAFFFNLSRLSAMPIFKNAEQLYRLVSHLLTLACFCDSVDISSGLKQYGWSVCRWKACHGGARDDCTTGNDAETISF